MLTIDDLKAQLPKSKRRNVTQNVVDTINNINNDEDEIFVESYKANFLSFISVMRAGQYKISDYMSAVKYASFKLMEYSNIDAYQATFPDRYARLMNKYSDQGDEKFIRDNRISPHVAGYNQNQLVIKIMEQTIIAPSILNAGLYQEALARQADLMLNAKSELVQTQAANSILVQLRPPEVAKIELDIGLKENDAIAELRKATQGLAMQNRLAIEAGVITPKDAIEAVIISGDVDDVV